MTSSPPAADRELVLGTAQLCSTYGAVSRRDAERAVGEAQELLEAAFEHGFGAVDTAPAYGDAEVAIGLSEIDFGVHTKFSSANPAGSLDESLRRLKRESVDTAYLHEPSAVMRGEEWLMSTARTVGRRADRLGASIYERSEFNAASASSALAAVQVPVNVLSREVDREAIAAAAANGVAVYARSVLLQGALIAPPSELPAPLIHLRPHLEELATLASDFGRTLLEVAIAWVRDIPGVSGLVLGAESAEQIASLGAAFKAPILSEDEIMSISALPVPEPAHVDPRRWLP